MEAVGKKASPGRVIVLFCYCLRDHKFCFSHFVIVIVLLLFCFVTVLYNKFCALLC